MDIEDLISRRSQQSQARWLDVNNNLMQLMERTGYHMTQHNGQRIYMAPGNEPAPPKGCEIFVGKLPRDLFEDELVPLFEKVGPIYSLRLMMEFSGLNRGYAFITYYSQAVASMAVTAFHNLQIRPNQLIGVYKSLDNCRLFMGGLPFDKSKADVLEQMRKLVDGIVDVIMYPSHANKNHNRGYVFIEFRDHRLAAMARRKLLPGSLVLWGVQLLVDWAEPLPQLDNNIMSKVTKLYIRNLDANLPTEDLHSVLMDYVPYEHITKVHKITDFAFVHFSSRKAAENALKVLQGATIKGEPIEVTWARPQIYSKAQQPSAPPPHYCMSLPPRIRKLIYKERQNHGPPEFLETPTPALPTSVDGNVSYCAPQMMPQCNFDRMYFRNHLLQNLLYGGSGPSHPNH